MHFALEAFFLSFVAYDFCLLRVSSAIILSGHRVIYVLMEMFSSLDCLVPLYQGCNNLYGVFINY